MNNIKKFNKRFIKKDHQTGRLLIKKDQKHPGEDDLTKPIRYCMLRDETVKQLNSTWRQTGIYFTEAKEAKEVKEVKSDKRIKLEGQAKELGIQYSYNISDSKLEEKINTEIEK